MKNNIIPVLCLWVFCMPALSAQDILQNRSLFTNHSWSGYIQRSFPHAADLNETVITQNIDRTVNFNQTMIGLDYNIPWRPRLLTYFSLNAGTIQITNQTFVTAPQAWATPGVVRSQGNYTPARFVMLGTGIKWRIKTIHKAHLIADLGGFGGYVIGQERSETTMSLPVTSASPIGFSAVRSGIQQETISRRWIPVGRVGLLGILDLSDRLSLTGGCSYYLSGGFMSGTWTCTIPNDSTVVSSGTYNSAGMSNLLLNIGAVLKMR
jgi:hypothetical protein